jgi:DNA-directed RNA polymerase subunit M/transcription elongation factor TFIIS
MSAITQSQEEASMEPTITGRTCPKCGSTDYRFRGRKTVAAEPGRAEAVETKYRCQACGHEWKVRQPE